MAEHNDFGQLAENLAADYLAEKGFTIISRNYRYHHAEIDIIAEEENLIIIVEVKARSYNTIISPEEAVNQTKIKSIVKAADAFLKANPTEKEVRFDIITVLPDLQGKLQITHLENAFESFESN